MDCEKCKEIAAKIDYMGESPVEVFEKFEHTDPQTAKEFDDHLNSCEECFSFIETTQAQRLSPAFDERLWSKFSKLKKAKPKTWFRWFRW